LIYIHINTALPEIVYIAGMYRNRDNVVFNSERCQDGADLGVWSHIVVFWVITP
jgi:hypothetical protein